jgi:hypothetical protein
MKITLPVRPWRHDLGHCLHTTMGVLLGWHGIDPLEALGAAWNFHYRPGDARREEYYFPDYRDSLLASLAPYHPVSSSWHRPADAADGWAQVRAAIVAGTPVAVAADNFELPFRPAYRDVHTNHLMVVHGFDDDAGTVDVCDPVPPRFHGPIRLDELTAARGSENPIKHDRDLFFTANPIGHRWLSTRVDAAAPVFEPDFVSAVVGTNLAGFAEGSTSDGVLAGLAGQRRFLTEWIDRLPDEDLVDELFIVAGAVLAMTGLHADWLTLAGERFADPRLRELGRQVEAVAHHWTALRIAVATARGDRAAAVPALRVRAARLLAETESVVERFAGRLRIPV